MCVKLYIDDMYIHGLMDYKKNINEIFFNEGHVEVDLDTLSKNLWFYSFLNLKYTVWLYLIISKWLAIRIRGSAG